MGLLKKWLFDSKPVFGNEIAGNQKKLRALLIVQLLKIATQDSKFRIWLKHPGLLLVSFYAAGPFNFPPITVNNLFKISKDKI